MSFYLSIFYIETENGRKVGETHLILEITEAMPEDWSLSNFFISEAEKDR